MLLHVYGMYVINVITLTFISRPRGEHRARNVARTASALCCRFDELKGLKPHEASRDVAVALPTDRSGATITDDERRLRIRIWRTRKNGKANRLFLIMKRIIQDHTYVPRYDWLSIGSTTL